MSDLQQAFFERELSDAEEAALAAELEASDEACSSFAKEASSDYARSAFPDPAGRAALKRRWLWWGGVALAVGLGWGLSRPAPRPAVLTASVDEQAFVEQAAPPQAKPRPQRAQVLGTAPDRLLVQRDAQGFLFSIETQRQGTGRLELRSLDGSVLRTLYTGSLAEGTWAFRWDGRGGDGQALLPGQYRLAWSHGDQALGKVVQVEAR